MHHLFLARIWTNMMVSKNSATLGSTWWAASWLREMLGLQGRHILQARVDVAKENEGIGRST